MFSCWGFYSGEGFFFLLRPLASIFLFVEAGEPLVSFVFSLVADTLYRYYTRAT
jgi:hypothetical protein